MIDALTAKDRIPTASEAAKMKKAILLDYVDEINLRIESYKMAQDDILDALYHGRSFYELFKKFMRGSHD